MNHKQLVDQLTALQAEMNNYKAEVSSLRNKVEAYENIEAAGPAAAITGPTSRRRMIKRFVAGVAGIGAMGLISGAVSTPSVLAETVADNAIEATSGPGGYGLLASSPFAPIRMVPTGSSGAPASGAHQTGELYVDSGGNLFYCTVAGSPGTWRKLGGSGTSGAFHCLSTPARVYETRTGSTPHPFTGNRNIQITGIGGVPTGATAISAIVAAVSSNFNSNQPFPSYGQIALSATGASSFTTVSFSTPLLTATSAFTSNLNASGQVVAAVYTPGYAIDLSIDVVGYFL